MKNKLLKIAIILGYELEQDSSKKWSIKNCQNNKLILYKEKFLDKWLISINGVPKGFIETKELIRIIENVF